MVPLWLVFILIFLICASVSLLLCGLARLLFPRFRSGEHKPGSHRFDLQPGFHRADLPGSGREIKTIELPLVGGPAFTLAITLTGIGAAFLLHFQQEQWTLLLIGLGATFGYMLIGFFDDWNKVYSQEGLRERTKFCAVLFVSMAAGILYFFLLPSGRESYSPYIDFPIIGPLLCPHPLIDPHTHLRLSHCPLETQGNVAYYAWLIFLPLVTGIIGSFTSLSVDFSDGLDGLAGGLVFSAALAFGIVVTGLFTQPGHPEAMVLELLALLCAGSVLGYLPWNWPSSWAARRGTAKRRAKIYMGDSGALGLGGILAMIAIFDRQTDLLLMIGAAFVLEGLSALISARILTRFFRKRLQILRFASTREHIHHTEFPLPFLATPLHHHFDLLGWDRRRLVYGAWALGACFAVLGVMVGLSPESWQRYLGRILVLILAWLVWSSGSWTRMYFVGKYPAERTRRRRLALYYGFPYQVMGLRLYHRVEIIEASEDVIETPAEELALWQRMNIFDARAMLGLYCYRAGYYPAALAQWTRIPESNRKLRPDIVRLLEEVDNLLALEKQETQPLRRDQILRQEPILSGNLSPADLPNPHEPVRSDESFDNRPGGRSASSPGSAYNGEEEEEKRQPTAPLRKDSLTRLSANGHTSVAGSSGSQDTARPARQNWFWRLLRRPTNKGNTKAGQVAARNPPDKE